MKRSMTLLMIVAAVLLLARLELSQAGSGEVALFDAPRGAWRATVRIDAPLEVLEEQDGWKRVRLEGWVSGTVPVAAGEAALSGSGESAGKVNQGAAIVPIPAVAPSGGKATVSGVLMPTHAERTASPGAGLVVLLLIDLETMDPQHAETGRECLGKVTASWAEIDRLHSILNQQLNSTQNFREATERHDRAKREVKRAEDALVEQIVECRRAADGIFENYTVQRVISDLAGRFEFVGVDPGRYRVVATEIGGDQPRAWALDCPVDGPGPVVLDSRVDTAAVAPYWGLNSQMPVGKQGKKTRAGS
jgi:hypothetical protein